MEIICNNFTLTSQLWFCMLSVLCLRILTSLTNPSFMRFFCDEDINTSATIIPSIEIVGPITPSRAQQLNHQVKSFLCSTYNIES
jgi:hypothetical protein